MSSELIKRKCLYYILSILVCFCYFQIFQENYTYAVDNLDSYHVFDSLDWANLICFLGVSSKLLKEKYLFIFGIFSFTTKISSTFIKESSMLIREYLDYMLSIFVCLCCFLFFSRKITYIYEVKVNNFWSHYIFEPLDQTSLIFFGDISLSLP